MSRPTLDRLRNTACVYWSKKSDRPQDRKALKAKSRAIKEFMKSLLNMDRKALVKLIEELKK